MELAGAHFDGHNALDAAVFFEKVNAEMLVETLDRRVLDRGLEQGMQNVETGLVGRKPRAFDLHPAKGAHVDVSVLGTAPRAAPMFELRQFLRGLLDEVLDHVLLAQPVTATDGVMEVIIEAIRRFLDASSAAFGRYRMATHRVNLGNERDL